MTKKEPWMTPGTSIGAPVGSAICCDAIESWARTAGSIVASLRGPQRRYWHSTPEAFRSIVWGAGRARHPMKKPTRQSTRVTPRSGQDRRAEAICPCRPLPTVCNSAE